MLEGAVEAIEYSEVPFGKLTLLAQLVILLVTSLAVGGLEGDRVTGS